PGVLPLPRERAMRDWIVANAVTIGDHMARDSERLQGEDDAIARQAAVLVRRNRIAATATNDAANDGVLVDVNDVVPQPIESPTHRIHDDVVRARAAENHPFDDVIVRALGRESGCREGPQGE